MSSTRRDFKRDSLIHYSASLRNASWRLMSTHLKHGVKTRGRSAASSSNRSPSNQTPARTEEPSPRPCLHENPLGADLASAYQSCSRSSLWQGRRGNAAICPRSGAHNIWSRLSPEIRVERRPGGRISQTAEIMLAWWGATGAGGAFVRSAVSWLWWEFDGPAPLIPTDHTCVCDIPPSRESFQVTDVHARAPVHGANAKPRASGWVTTATAKSREQQSYFILKKQLFKKINHLHVKQCNTGWTTRGQWLVHITDTEWRDGIKNKAAVFYRSSPIDVKGDERTKAAFWPSGVFTPGLKGTRMCASFPPLLNLW